MSKKRESLLPSLSLWSKPVFRCFRQDMDDLFEDFFEKALNFKSDTSIFDDIQTASSFPKINVAETDKEYSVEIAVAGFDKEDVKLELKDDLLFIRADKKEESKDVTKNYIRKEISSRAFQRGIKFPCSVSTDGAEAVYKDGIITVKISKKIEQEEECRVPIQIK